MQNIEEQALATYSETLPLWLRYVDDTITAVHENKVGEFHEQLNKQNTSIQFTKEIEENAKIPVLDCLLTRENNTLRTTVSRNQHILTDHLTKRLTTPKRDYGMNLDEKNTNCLHLNTVFISNTVFIKNNYNTDFIERNTCISRTTALTTHAPQQPLFLTYEGPPKPWHAYYDLTTSELHTNPCSLHDAYSLLLTAKTNLKTYQEQFTRSNAPTARPLMLVRPAETEPRD